MKIHLGIKALLVSLMIISGGLIASSSDTTVVKKPSFSDRFKTNLSNAGTSIKTGLSNAGSSIKSGFSKAGTSIKSGAQTIGSGIKTGTKSVLKTASKVSEIVQPYADSAFALGQTALEHKNSQSMAREEHQRLLEANKLGHEQNKEIQREQQQHEFRMKQMDLEIERMRLQHNPLAENKLLQEREQEMENFEGFLSEQQKEDTSNTEM